MKYIHKYVRVGVIRLDISQYTANMEPRISVFFSLLKPFPPRRESETVPNADSALLQH